MLVLEATAKVPPNGGDLKHINIRYAEPGYSKILDEYNAKPDHISEEPTLKLEPVDGNADKTLEATPGKEVKIGRTKDNDYVINEEGVTR